MITYRSLEFSQKCKTVIALGLFDGVHLGHQRVISEAVKTAEKLSAVPAVFTFTVGNERPEKKRGQGLITADSVKQKVFEKLGAKFVFAPEFEAIKGIEAEAFVRDVLIDRLGAVGIVCGYDFHFGAQGAANADRLREYAHGCAVSVVEALRTENGEAVSSTRIRGFIENGEIERANALLGYKYKIDFSVVSGMRLGSKLGFPTINQEYPGGFAVPKFGVYASAASVHGEVYPAVTNIGVKPTVGGVKNPLAETYIIGVDDDLYGEKIEVSLFEFLRGEKKFASIDELKRQIAVNAEQAKKIFAAQDFTNAAE